MTILVGSKVSQPFQLHVKAYILIFVIKQRGQRPFLVRVYKDLKKNFFYKLLKNRKFLFTFWFFSVIGIKIDDRPNYLL